MRRLLILSLFATACATTPKTAPPQTDDPWPPADAALGIVNPALATLMAKHWAWTMEQSPLWATQLGVHRFDAALADRSRAGIEAARKQTRTWLESIKAIDGLEGTDLVTQKLIVEYLNNSIASEVCEFSDWSINARSNPVTEWNYLPELHTVESEEDATNLVSRYEGIGKAIDDTIANLERGVAAKHFANAESTRRVIKMVKDQLAKPIADWPLMSPTKADHPDWPQDKLQAFRKDIETAVTESIKPGLEEYLELVETKILPHARPADASGLTALPQGDACYAARVREYTNLDRTAEQIHKTGLAEIARINGEMKALGGKLFGTEDLPTVLQKLRTDPALYFDTEEQVEDKARTALAKAKAKMGDWFGLVPKADCIVTRIPDYEAPFTTVAYYRPPVPDGSKPGEYFINVYEPKTRPRYEAEALAFHEAIPGHHLQIAITQELPALPAFRKHEGMTAFVEGWALYTEQLSDEMGLYTGDLDRMGRLSYEAWRASRLVVDTGLHAMGWSRDDAKKYMEEHTALAKNNIDNEVDRYITWPGQALAYKTGQLEILRMRQEAKAALGDKFDIKGFHDAVLGGGAVTLGLLEDQVRAWVERTK